MKIITGTDRQTCDECEKEIPVLVELGEPVEYGSVTVHLCATCLRAALMLIEAVEATELARAALTERMETKQ